MCRGVGFYPETLTGTMTRIYGEHPKIPYLLMMMGRVRWSEPRIIQWRSCRSAIDLCSILLFAFLMPQIHVPWTPLRVLGSLGVFLLSALLEIGGGWLVWRGIRDRQPPRAVNAVSGTLVVALYAWSQLLQPPSPASQFGRIYAAYGAIFIAGSYAWGAAVDGLRLDAGDFVAVGLSIAAAVSALFWPRRGTAVPG